MAIGRFARWACLCVLLAGVPTPAAAQIYETVGTRAQGMGGAFVAVANDSSATWWNPAGLADGPFLDMALARSTTEVASGQRHRGSWFALGTPPFGFSYYRLRISEIASPSPTVAGAGRRQDLAVSQLGATVLRTLVTGVHVGSTVKWLRGSIDDGDTGHEFDLDLGALAVAGPVRLGIAARNLREPDFEDGTLVLERQVRIGAAFDAGRLPGPPLTVAVDADLATYAVGGSERRVVAVGAEQWFAARRLGVRAGGRFNTVGDEERSVTAGVSVAPRAGFFLDAFVVHGGSAGERGWGIAARTSF